MACVKLRIAQKRAYVWNVDDIATLRAEHRICGLTTGTLPHMGSQNIFLGVPLVLMPEEVVLLVEQKLAVLVDDPKAHRQPTSEQIETWRERHLADARHSANQHQRGRSSTDKSMTEEAIQKRKERERKRAAQQNANPDSQVFIPDAPLPQKHEETSSKRIPSLYTMVIPAESSDMEWYRPDENCIYSTIESAKEAGIWDYPSNLHERAKCGVFADLWSQGYYLGGGIKFGGDYLVYPGDPLRYHSHFTASVIDSDKTPIHPMEIVAHGRLGTATKKSHLLCTWDDENKTVSHLSIEWAGFG